MVTVISISGTRHFIFTLYLVEMSKQTMKIVKNNNKPNGNGKSKYSVLVQELNNSMTEETISPQLQYFSSDVAVKDTSDGPKVQVHMYGNNDEQTVNRAIVWYLDTISKLDSISKEGKKIRLTSK